MLKYYTFVSLNLLLTAVTSHAHFGHDHPSVTSALGDKYQHSEIKGLPTIKVSLVKQEDFGKKKRVQIKLTKIKDDQPITFNDLKEVHTKKVHVLVIDDSLTDYHHIHPEALKEPGVYQFEWEPQKSGSYKLWVDFFPVATNQQQFISFDFIKNDKSQATIDRKVSLESKVEGYTFKLSFNPEKPSAKTPVMAKLNVTNDKGEEVKSLEPIMGAFAHMVGFNADLKSIIHTHPVGPEPSKDSARGGPNLEFHIENETAGYTKLFVQVIINGKELNIPFGVNFDPSLK